MNACTDRTEGLCARPFRARGLCARHYQRARVARTLPLRPYWVVNEDGPVVNGSTCWLWQRKLDRDGYGMKTYGRMASWRAHRWVWDWLIGDIPRGLELDHLCHVRACVNPDHLEPVTHAENMRRMRAHRAEVAA